MAGTEACWVVQAPVAMLRQNNQLKNKHCAYIQLSSKCRWNTTIIHFVSLSIVAVNISANAMHAGKSTALLKSTWQHERFETNTV